MLYFGIFLAIAYLYNNFLTFQEQRKDLVILEDKFLEILPTVNCSSLVSIVLVGCPLMCFAFLNSGRGFVLEYEIFLLKYGICLLTKMLTLYVTPLSTPRDFFDFEDHVSAFLCRTSKAFTKDLFFSGHMCVCCLSLFTCNDYVTKNVIFIGAIVMGISLLLTRMHYTVDVLIAPFVSYTCHKFIENYF
eukprot:COSAG01_NODE_22108_length_871_cov_1.468912_1_plen_189_part_00